MSHLGHSEDDGAVQGRDVEKRRGGNWKRLDDCVIGFARDDGVYGRGSHGHPSSILSHGTLSSIRSSANVLPVKGVV